MLIKILNVHYNFFSVKMQAVKTSLGRHQGIGATGLGNLAEKYSSSLTAYILCQNNQVLLDAHVAIPMCTAMHANSTVARGPHDTCILSCFLIFLSIFSYAPG